MNDQSSTPGFIPPNSQGMDSDPFDTVVTQPLRSVAATVDDNPDDAARAVDLSKATGVAAPIIAADLPNFEQVHKASLANQIMRSNPALIDYVRSHPMAASVSNDDWANLADVAKSSSHLHSLLALDPARGAMEGAVAGFGEGLVTKPAMQQSIDDWYGDKPLAWALWSALAFPAIETLRGFNAIMGAQFGAIKGGAETAYKAITGDADAAKDFGEDAVNNAGVILAGSMAEPWESTAFAGQAIRQREALTAAKPWLDANLIPPRGIHPLVDENLADLNAEGVSRLKDILSASQKSSTRERSYEMFNHFVNQQHGEATIGIHGDAVAALYGNKVPEPGDGILGFVPRIGDQLLAANLSGADVHVPIKEWLSQVDPQIAQQLQDDIRMFHGGITAREAKEPVEPKPMVDAPIAQVRGGAGLEPRFAIGDRKLTLAYYSGDNYIFTNGDKTVQLNLFPDDEKKELYVDYIGVKGVAETDAANSLGPATVRDMLRQLKEVWPGYTLTGDRVSGARELAASQSEDYIRPVPRIKLNLDKLPEPGDRASPSSLKEVDDKWRQLGPDTWAKTTEAVDTVVHSELRRIVGQYPELVSATDMYAKPGSGGLAEGIGPQGVFIPSNEHPPIIAWNALNPDAIGIGRHEAIHYLRGYGFFTDEEWAALGWHALENDWLGKYEIREKYPHLDAEGKIEEAVAEGYRTWAKGVEPVSEPTGLVAKAFQKMKDLWEAIRDNLRRIFGQDVDVGDLLKSIHEGRIARQGGEPVDAEGAKFSGEDKVLPKELTQALSQPTSSKPLPENMLRNIHRQGDYFNQNRDLYDHAVENDIVRNFDQFMNASGHQLEAIIKLAKEKNLPLPGKPPTAYPSEPKYSISDEDFQNIKANSLGLDIKSWRNLQDAIKARHESDLVAAVERAEKEQRQTQTTEWKKNLPEVRAEVERTIRQRPDVASDLFVNSGEYEGQKLKQRIPLKADDLTDEQKAALPSTYYAKSGLPIADVARLFGYQDSQHLIERLSVMAQARGERTPQEHLRSLIDDETQLRMEQKYGNLESNIMEKASDQALSDTDINLLVDEYHASGMLAKQPTIDKNTIKAQALDAFSKLPIGGISSQRLMAEIGRHDRNAERALIPGQVDEVAALKSMERKVYTGMMAAEARKVEKLIKQFDKTTKSLYPREKGNLPQTYLNMIHQILSQIGKSIDRTAGDLRTELAKQGGESTLEGFVTDLQDNGQETRVWDKLFDPSWHTPYKELTVDEFKKVKDSVDSLNFIGKNIKKIISTGVKADLDTMKSILIDSLESFGVKDYKGEKGRGLGPIPPGIYLDFPRTFLANSLTLETIFGRWDHFDPSGPWTQWGLRPLIDANGEEHIMRRDVAEKLSAIYDSDKSDAKMKDPVSNPLFRDPRGGNLIPFNRSNLRAIMLNTGSRGSFRSNLTYLAEGHRLNEADILGWIDQHATKEDWDWCQKIWDLFKNELWEPAQQMRRGLDGVGAESLEVQPIQTPFGEYPGGYYPVIRSEIGKQSEKSGEKVLFGKDYTRATTWEGYAQERRGSYSPLRLDLEPMAARIGQIIHDIKMRPAVLNAAKLFYDKDIQMAIARHVGQEYADLLVPYLRDVAGAAQYRSKAVEMFDKATDTIQKNLVVSLIGLNPGTVAKHFPTALALSLTEVGPKDFIHAVQSLNSVSEATGESNYQMIMGKLDTLQNRSRTWSQTLTGAADEFIPGGSMRTYKQKIAEWSSKPIALSDMMSAIPTGLAAYQRAIKDGNNEGDAIFLANRAVRRAHGDASITNRSGVQRSLPKAITTFYTFFNDMLNRRAEVIWRASDALGVTGNHTWAQAKAEIQPIVAGLFSTVLFTAFIEQMVSPITFNRDDSNGWKAAKMLAKDQSAGLVVARDVVNWLVEGHDPSLGLYTTAFHEFGDVFKDLRPHKFSKENAGKIIKNSAAFLGVVTGRIPLAVGKAGEFAYGTAIGHEHPRGPWGWASGLRYGTLRGHSPTFERWRKGR